jgi:hypothetical protein
MKQKARGQSAGGPLHFCRAVSAWTGDQQQQIGMLFSMTQQLQPALSMAARQSQDA